MTYKPKLETVQLSLSNKLQEFESLLNLLLAKKGDSIYDCQLTYMQAEINTLEACINGIVEDDLNEVELLDDGFGNMCNSLCNNCGNFMEIVRPGKFQCGECG